MRERQQVRKQLEQLGTYAVNMPNFRGRQAERLLDPLEWRDNLGFCLPHILVAMRTEESFQAFLLWAQAVVHLKQDEKYRDVCDGGGQTTLHWALRSENFRAAVILLDMGASAARQNNDGRTAIHLLAMEAAAVEGNQELVNERLHMLLYLLKKNSDGINAVDCEGRTALHWAASAGLYPMVKLLLEFGADVNARDNKGETALFGADVNARDNKGETALFGAAISRRGDHSKECVFHMIVKYDAADLANNDELTLQEYLISCGELEMYNFIRELAYICSSLPMAELAQLKL